MEIINKAVVFSIVAGDKVHADNTQSTGNEQPTPTPNIFSDFQFFAKQELFGFFVRFFFWHTAKFSPPPHPTPQ